MFQDHISQERPLTLTMPMYNPYSDPQRRTQAKTAPPAARSMCSDNSSSLPNSISSREDGEGQSTKPSHPDTLFNQADATQATVNQADKGPKRRSKRRSTSLSIDRLKTEEEHMAEVIPALWGSEHDNISRPRTFHCPHTIPSKLRKEESKLT